MGAYVPSGGAPPPPTLNNNFTGIAGNMGLNTNSTSMIITASGSPYAAGTYLVIGTLLTYGNTAAGHIASQIRTTGNTLLATAELWIPDGHVYTVQVEALIVNATARPFYFMYQTDATITGGGISRYGSAFAGSAAGTGITVIQMA